MRHLGLVSLLSLLVTLPALAQDDDVGRATEGVCCGANCCSLPITGGSDCFMRNDVNPENDCEVCDPSVSRSVWTNICDAGTTPAPDAGSVVTPPMDAGGGTPDTDGGCSVGATRGSVISALALLAALGLLVRRRV